jgi:hypothetical protein
MQSVGVEIDIQGNDVSIVSGDTTPSSLDQTGFWNNRSSYYSNLSNTLGTSNQF